MISAFISSELLLPRWEWTLLFTGFRHDNMGIFKLWHYRLPITLLLHQQHSYTLA
jgi:hypothetical protein